MYSSNHIEHCRKQLYYLTRTKRNITSAQNTFNSSTSVTGHKQGKVVFPPAHAIVKFSCKLRSQ
jgi:hypothetical protein